MVEWHPPAIRLQKGDPLSKMIVACAQQQMRLFDSPDSFRREISRFLNMARAKGAQLAVFPPLSGVMATSPRVQGFSVGLLKQAAESQRRHGSFWSRTRGAVAEGTASLLGASYRRAFLELLRLDPSALAADYEGTFSELAKAYEIAIVAGSAYVPDAGGVIRNRVSVFGADGRELGRHDKMILSPEDAEIAQPGDAWHVIPTPLGGLGILFAEEALYPEAGRILAYEGADLLVVLGAIGDESLAAHVRHAAIARAQDNRCFAVTSFLVGRNYMAAEEGSAAAFQGRTGIYAPLEMTPRYSGVLVEIGTSDAEGLLTSELDRPKLQWLWDHGSFPVRREMPMALFGRYLPALYGSTLTLTDAWSHAGVTPEETGVTPVQQTDAETPPAEPEVSEAEDSSEAGSPEDEGF